MSTKELSIQIALPALLIGFALWPGVPFGTLHFGAFGFGLLIWCCIGFEVYKYRSKQLGRAILGGWVFGLMILLLLGGLA